MFNQEEKYFPNVSEMFSGTFS